MACQKRFGKLRRASFYRRHCTEVCALSRLLVTLNLAIRWLKLHTIDESMSGRVQFKCKYRVPWDDAYRTKEYDEEGWQVLSTQLRDGEATKIKVMSRTETCRHSE